MDTRREAQTIYYSLPDGPVIRVMALLQDDLLRRRRDARSGDETSRGRARCDG